MRKLLAAILLLMFLVPAALAEDEDFSIFDLIDDEVILDEEEPTNDTAPTIPVHNNIRGKEYYS